MNQLMQHTNVAIKLNKNNINMNLVKKFPLKEIIDCCDRIEERNMQANYYEENQLFQEELIEDREFIRYLDIAYKKNYDISKFENILEQIRNNNKKMSDYPIKEVFGTLNNEKLVSTAYYDFLNYYIKDDFETRKIVTSNLNFIYSEDSTIFKELTDEERNLLKTHLLDSYNIIPRRNIKDVYRYLVNNEDLINLIDFLYSEKLYIPLTIENYEEIDKNAKRIEEYIRQISKMINNNEITYMMLLRWISNNCNVYDLKTILDKIKDMEESKLESAFSNKTSYINFIYGSKLKKFPMNNLYGAREDIIIYAIREDKKSFLKLVEGNMDVFFSISVNSILFNKEFYTKYINLNEITLKQLVKLKAMENVHGSRINNLKVQNYTFDEIATLYKASREYIELYNELLDLKVDERLVRIRQLIKKDLLNNIDDEGDIVKLAEKLKIKPLYLWIEKDFSHIKDLSSSDALQILIHFDNIQKFISQINNSREIAYLLRNNDKINEYDSLDSIKNDIQNLDEYWIKLKQEMEFSNEFLQKYSNNIQIFLLNNGAELAYTYYSSRNKEQKEAFKLIVKAELMGEFKRLKYHTDDLKKEIDYELFDYQLKEWSEVNSSISEEKYNVGEYDDFYHTMVLGEQPKVTCLSYKHGGYNTCLLACFDSNKKILYAKINDKIVARAMVRLTKGTYDKNKKNAKSLSFVDVETGIQTNNEKNEEGLTLFLERPYIAGISDSEAHEIKKLFIKLLKIKAEKMNALLVLSNYYREEIEEEFVSSEYYMYISKSKSSSQYLDSLSGQATVSDEGQYKANLFLIWKRPLKKTESIEKMFVA